MSGGSDASPAVAGIGLRAAARLVDVVLVMAPAWLLLAPLLVTALGSSPATLLAGTALAWTVTIGYETHLTAATGQTIGKRAVGIRVVTIDDARPPTVRASFSRAALPPLLGTLFWVGWVVPYLWAVWRSDRRGLHDLLARTRVEPLG